MERKRRRATNRASGGNRSFVVGEREAQPSARSHQNAEFSSVAAATAVAMENKNLTHANICTSSIMPEHNVTSMNQQQRQVLQDMVRNVIILLFLLQKIENNYRYNNK